ncbi:MAG: SdiA-regulated domain-containing protein [Bacteroidota bacterium]|jgi:uncharacterized protein YjiK
MRQLLWICLLYPAIGCAGHLPSTKKLYTEVSEPSDLIPDGKGGFVVVSDNGTLFRTNAQGNIIQKSTCNGQDYEAITSDNKYYYLSDERSRTVTLVDKESLNCLRSYPLDIQTGNNAGLETFFFDPAQQVFIGISEKSPITVYTFSLDFHILSSKEITFASDISSGCFNDGFYYLLSDEDHKVFKCNPDLNIIESWSVKIINPEGICFDSSGSMVICSDEMQMFFYYNLPANE